MGIKGKKWSEDIGTDYEKQIDALRDMARRLKEQANKK